jgi:hypothetical protein
MRNENIYRPSYNYWNLNCITFIHLKKNSSIVECQDRIKECLKVTFIWSSKFEQFNSLSRFPVFLMEAHILNLQIWNVGKWWKCVTAKNSTDNVITCYTNFTKMLLNLTSEVTNNLAFGFAARDVKFYHNFINYHYCHF